MKKRIISLAIAVMVRMLYLYFCYYATYAEEACGETDTVSRNFTFMRQR